MSGHSSIGETAFVVVRLYTLILLWSVRFVNIINKWEFDGRLALTSRGDPEEWSSRMYRYAGELPRCVPFMISCNHRCTSIPVRLYWHWGMRFDAW